MRKGGVLSFCVENDQVKKNEQAKKNEKNMAKEKLKDKISLYYFNMELKNQDFM